ARRRRPVRECGNACRTSPLIQIDPDAIKVIKISPKTEAGTRPLESLGLSDRARVVVIGPPFSGCGMRTQAENCQLASDYYLRDDFIVFAALKIGGGVNRVLPRPPRRRKDHVQSVRVGALVCIRNDLSASLLLIAVSDAPFNDARI